MAGLVLLAGATALSLVAVDQGNAEDVSAKSTYRCPLARFPGPMTEQPGPTNTGVPADAKLVTVRGDLHTDHDGQLISGVKITGRLYVDHDDVRVRCTAVKRSVTNKGKNLRIWLSTLGDPRGVREGSALKWSDYSLRRVEVVGTYDGLKAQGDVDVRDSYLHDMFRTKDPTQENGYTHNDAVQINRGSRMSFVHNTIYAWTFSEGERAGAHLFEGRQPDRAGYMTSAFMVIAQEPVEDVLIENNLIRGSYTRFLFKKGPVKRLKLVGNDAQWRGAYYDKKPNG